MKNQGGKNNRGGKTMRREYMTIMYIVRKGKEVVIATESREKAKTMQMLKGGVLTKEEVKCTIYK